MIQTPAGYGGAARIKRYLDYYQPGYGPAPRQPDVFSPASLFVSGEQGLWLDPSDFSTMFQDAAGTTPVTAVEQSVLCILDKSGRGNNATQASSGSAPVISARVNLLLDTAVLATQSVTTIATTYTLYFGGTGSITLSGTATGTYTAGSTTITCTAGTLTLTVTGTVTTADFRSTTDGVGLPVYQRVTTATDYDTVNFPYYLRFDGSNDSIATGSVNFTATDKMTYWAGLRKLDGVGSQYLVELGSGLVVENGFNIVAPPTKVSAYDFRVGTNQRVTDSNYPTPITNILSVQQDIAASTPETETKARINGVSVTLTGSNLTTGNFINAAINIGRRNSSVNPFNGRLYSLIIRGAQSTLDQVTSTENWVNGKTKAY